MKDNNHGTEATINQGDAGTHTAICTDHGLDHEVVEIQDKEKETESPSWVGRFKVQIGPFMMGAHLTYMDRIHPLLIRILTG